MGGSHPRGGERLFGLVQRIILSRRREDNKEIGLQRFNHTLFEEKDGRGVSRGY